MHVRRTLMATAIISTFTYSSAAYAQDAAQSLPEIVVTATPFGANENAQILTPAKVLAGEELRNKLGSSLGDTLSNELGVSTSSFGAGASRPIIRGLGGPRIRVMQNGLGAADVSTISEDHAVSIAPSTSRQIEILRGPAALLYGSGAIGGLINVVNERIPTRLEPRPTGEVELRYGTADKSKSASVSADASISKIGLHLDSEISHASDYEIPGSAVKGDPQSASGRLPNSFTRQHGAGFGLSYIEDWGHFGASVASFDHNYGVPSDEGARIDLDQNRYDTDLLVKRPFEGFESVRIKFGYTDYHHTEYDLEDVPEVNFSNRSLETRWELTHQELNGWRGMFGIQTEHGRLAAKAADPSEPTTVPETQSQSQALFAVEEKAFGPLTLNAGLRFESAKREPVARRERSFDLSSYSIGSMWDFLPGYGFGSTISFAQRAPSIEELYSSGAHHATETFDVGNPDLEKETSRNLELSLQKTTGLVRWKANVFHNRVKDFIFGRLSGNTFDEEGNPGGELNERLFEQADAVIRGAEAEISYQPRSDGMSARAFADTSRGKLSGQESLPLQPATRFGIDLDYKHGQWRAGTSVVHAKRQDRLALFETATPAYTRVDAKLAYTQRYANQRITWFASIRNLLDEDIRISTSLLKDQAPLAGRSLVLGVRTAF
ncbi:TonB-dependent receptor [Oxalobacteraceae bacterium R-40]|uniref:TonB-dependent receptor n=1 Tax=Keguizhuia sedimenti TaxID=3064264 RepID=A0ABU1BJ94_9BURK|nr:TonB-dependent receptor [Oxalobacteraceae bacterium R-40]